MPKMRWDCLERGCFNWKQRPKIEMFDNCFENGVAFGDVDGIVELGGNALALEWKSEPIEIPAGQMRMYRTLTVDRTFTVLLLAGDARTMKVTHWRRAFGGRVSGWTPASLERAKEFVRGWARWAKANPCLRVVPKPTEEAAA